MNMSDVKAIQIPDDRYEQLEYINFNGDDYIITSYVPWSGMTFEITKSYNSDCSGLEVDGHGNINSNNRAFIGVINTNQVFIGSGAQSPTVSNTPSIYDIHKYTLKVSADSTNNYFKIDDVNYLTDIACNYSETNRQYMVIGACYTSSGISFHCHEKVYNVKFYNADVLVGNCIPVRRKSDNKLGLLYIRANQNSFLFWAVANDLAEAGPVVSNAPIYIKKIEDSNGNIIWGSQEAFPYRRLDYIYFSGTEHLDTGMIPAVNFYFLNCKITKRTDTWAFIWGAAHTVNNTYFRLFFQGTENGKINPRLKDTNTDAIDPGNKIIQLRLRNYATNNSSGTYWWGVKDLGTSKLSTGDGTTELMRKYYNNSTYACNFNNFSTTIGLGQYHANNSWGSAGAQAKMEVYRYFIRATTDTSSIVHDQYPCQRKSDGVCGLYDVITNTFYPMQGTNITSAAAGPVLDEYWDLTAPE